MTKKLIDVEDIGGRTLKTWLHTGESGRPAITYESIQDVEPVMQHAKAMGELQNKKADFWFAASIPANVIDDLAYNLAPLWGCSIKEAFEELTDGKSERGQKVWDMLCEDRDYRKFQGKQ